MENSKIEWTNHTFNPWYGCTKVSPGCDHCYAEAKMDHRFHMVQWGPHGVRRRTTTWKQPYRWAREAKANGTRPLVFCASLADVFDNKAPAEWRADLFAMIRDTTEMEWLLLTKRPENIRKMLPPDWDQGYSNVWLGTTTEDQERYDQRWVKLSRIPAKIHFISYEPALTPLKLAGGYPDWVICGGETGLGARQMNPLWARKLRDECVDLGIPFFMKQMTDRKPIPDDLLVRQYPSFDNSPSPKPGMLF